MCVASLRNVCLVIALSLLATNECAKIKRNNFEPRIIGGHVATEPYPFMASLQKKTIFGLFHICGGSIINQRTVVTAAHCLAQTSPAVLVVHVGENNRTVNNDLEYQVVDIHYHAKWNSFTQDYDVGLVRIAEAFTFGLNVQPIKLVDAKEKIRDGSYATVLGWGFTDLNNPQTVEELRVAKVPIVKQSTCNRQLDGRVTKRMICAGFRNGGVDACQMDSGGPLVANNKLIGIVSWGISCAQPHKPGVYTRVSELVPWIENILFKFYNEIL